MAEPIRVAQVLNRMDSGGIESVVMNYYRPRLHLLADQVERKLFLEMPHMDGADAHYPCQPDHGDSCDWSEDQQSWPNTFPTKTSWKG